jgi:sigma-B regulation protein RsbU (phosphoserine phosphatase)
VIRRQAHRLGRLIDDLLLAASARSGVLSFKPKPVDLAQLTTRVLREVEASLPRKRFDLQPVGDARVLADETLLAQSLWSLFTYTAAIASPGEPIRIEVTCTEALRRISVSIAALAVSSEDFEHAFTPFAVVQYEGVGGPRMANGLYFCREVAHLHGGHLRLQLIGEHRGSVTMELPA